MNSTRRTALLAAATAAFIAGILFGAIALQTGWREGRLEGLAGAIGSDGWYRNVLKAQDAALIDDSPLLVFYGDGGPTSYAYFRTVRALVDAGGLGFVRCRIDYASEGAVQEARNLRAIPTLIVFDPKGDEITRLEGIQEIEDVGLALRRSIEFPLPRAALEGRAREDAGAARRLVEVCLESKRSHLALEVSEILLRHSAAPRDLLLVARARVEARQEEAGARLAMEVAAADPGLAPEARWWCISALLRRQRDAEAAQAMAEAVAADTRSTFVRRILVAHTRLLTERWKDPGAAVDFLEDFLRAAPGSPHAAEAKYLAANLYGISRAGAPRALDLYRQAMEEGDDRVSEMAVRALADFARRSGLTPEAAEILRRRLAAAPDGRRDDVQLFLASVEAARGESATAVAGWTALGAGEGERSDDAVLALALYRLETEADLEAARAALETHLARFGDRETAFVARLYLGKVHLFAGRFGEAGQIFEPLSDRQDRVGEEARQHLEIVLEAQSDTAIAEPFVAALMRRARGQGRQALTDLEGLLRRAPQSPLADDVLIEIAKTAADLRDYGKAERALRRVLSDYPGGNQAPAATQWLVRARSG